MVDKMKARLRKNYLNYLTFFLISAVFGACSKETKEVEILNEQNQLYEKYYVDLEKNYKQGKYERYFPSGNIAEEATYKRDTLDGERKFYYESGQLDRIQHYLFGIFQGEFRSYYLNGKLSAKGNYLNNEMVGSWKRYYSTGELMEEVTFVNNDENGPFKEYFKNGKVKTEGSYIKGPYEHGELKEFDENGSLIRKANCDQGICNTIWVKK